MCCTMQNPEMGHPQKVAPGSTEDRRSWRKVTHLVLLLSGDIQVPLAADHCLIVTCQDLKGIPQVPAGLSLPNPIPDSSGKAEQT